MRASSISLTIVIFQTIFARKMRTTMRTPSVDAYHSTGHHQHSTSTEPSHVETTSVDRVTDYYDDTTDIAATTEPQHPTYGSAVFASSYVRECRYDAARRHLRVEKLFNQTSYSGYITVDRRYNSNLFFWLILSQKHPNVDPVVTWLMGHPGYSSMYGVLQENGPFRVAADGANFTYAQHSWTEYHNMLYIDNPVGIGYSFTENDAGYSRSQNDVAANLYEFMSQFYEIFPNLRDNPLYLAGESTGAKFAVSLAYAIHERNPSTHLKMNLRGVFVGNGFLDPLNMMMYSEFLYRFGVVDYATSLWMENLERNIERLITMQDWTAAMELHDKIQGILRRVGFDHPYDITREKFDLLSDLVPEFLNNPATRERLNVGKMPFHNDPKVYQYLRDDYLQSVRKKVEKLLPHCRILIYTGQYDTLVTRAKQDKYLRKLEWSAAVSFIRQEPINWYVNEHLEGYVTKVTNLTEVIVRGANHMGAMSKSRSLYCLLKLFTDNRLMNDRNLRMNII